MKNYLQKPTLHLEEEKFLVQRENLITGLWRALRIFYEYLRGFYVFRNIKNCITVFGSARFGENNPYYSMGRAMGYMLASHGFTVMTGGGPGIMEAANRGAKEGGGLSVSCHIRLPNLPEEHPNPYVDKKITMHYFFVRKVMLTKYSLAFIVMPGGFGTLDELFETATLIQTNKIKNFPLVLMGKEYWQPLINFLKDTLLQQGTIFSEDFDKLMITDSPEEALLHIQSQLRKIAKRQ